ncbi:cell division protein FtsZ [Glycocaulis abyssi]|uniref:Cell division protein FtsZ n=1 Tax=Glycocaulis abyssi TaxID=1433403 RepID=A0ABV9N9G2_9PROT
MALNISAPEATELKPRILVFGVGGAGGNAVNNMIDANLEGVDFVVANTDAQALQRSGTRNRIQIGHQITQGLGAGARPEIGMQSAEDSISEIIEYLQGAHMVFITAGMGGGTGTGAAPVIARAAREQGILTVGVVTKPFHFEGAKRMRLAEAGIEQLQGHVDTLIVIPNQNLFRIATEKTTFAEAFSMADQVLHSGVRGITDLMVMPGLINLDFADVRTVMNEMGKAMMGTGEASGEKRAIEAAHAAINNPLLDDVSMKGARGVLINITGGMDMTLYEVDEAANEIRDQVDPDANIIVGSTFDESLNGTVRVSVVATGIEAEQMQQADPRRRAEPASMMSTLKPREIVRPAQPLVRRLNDEAETARAKAAADGGIHAKAAAWRAAQEAQSSPVEDEPAPARADIIDDAVSAPDAYMAGAEAEQADTRPEVVRHQERLEEAAQTIRREPAPEPEPREEAPARRGLSIFGRRAKTPAAPVEARTAPRPPAQAPRAPAPAEPVQRTGPSGDLFGEEFDDADLDIPAFLRRQAN